MRTLGALLVGIVALSTGVLSNSPATQATLIDMAAVGGNNITTATLAAPTNLFAAAGSNTINLTWTATTSPSATGYQILRATSSGGPYTLISTVTGGATTSVSDSTASGTVYYVLRSIVQNWTSTTSNEATATAGPVTTPLTTCASQAADTGGNGNGYEINPSQACAKDTVVAQDLKSGSNRAASCTDSGKDRHRFWNYSLPVPANASAINGIQVQIDAYATTGNGTGQICVQLSPDGGTTWTAPKSTPNLTTAPITYLLGSPTDLWATSWTSAQLTNTQFRVRIIDVDDTGNKSFSLDYIGIRVTYTP